MALLADSTGMTIKRILILSLAALTLSSCSNENSIEFKGDRLMADPVQSDPVNKPVVAKTLAQTNGGIVQRKTASGYKVDLSFGGPVNSAVKQTPSGYKARLNFSGQSAD